MKIREKLGIVLIGMSFLGSLQAADSQKAGEMSAHAGSTAELLEIVVVPSSDAVDSKIDAEITAIARQSTKRDPKKEADAEVLRQCIELGRTPFRDVVKDISTWVININIPQSLRVAAHDIHGGVDFIEYAANQNDADLVKEFLKYPVPAGAATCTWYRSFGKALEHKNLAMIEAFLGLLLRPDAKAAKFTILPYDIAQAVTIPGAMELFMAHFKESGDYSPLHEALLWVSDSSYHHEHLYGNPEIARALISYGAKSDYQTVRSSTPSGGGPIKITISRPLFKSITCAQAQAKKKENNDDPSTNPYAEIIRILIDSKADLTAINGEGEAADEQVTYQRTTKNTSIAILDMLLQQDPIVHANRVFSETNQFFNNPDIANLIKLYSYNPQYMLAAICANRLKRVGFLLDNGFDANITNKNKKSGLHYAAEENYRDIVQELLARKANVGAQDNHGDTPLHLAAENGNSEVVQFLLAAKANSNSASTYTSRDQLADGGSHRRRRGPAQKYRRRAGGGGYENISSIAGTTPLMPAVLRADLDIVRDLLKAGADANKKNAKGQTALDQLNELIAQQKEEARQAEEEYVSSAEYQEIMKLLQERAKPDAGDGKSN